jgi:MYXO-CTERM domain-containing protein
MPSCCPTRRLSRAGRGISAITYLLLPALLLVAFTTAHAQTAPATIAAGGPRPLVPWGATWRYHARGGDPGPRWRALDFDDAGWATGQAQLGYGQAGERTLIDPGPGAGSRPVTTYFRTAFTWSPSDPLGNVVLRVRHDDGAVIYLNGQEIYRAQMPAGVVGPGTLSAAAVSGGRTYQQAIDRARLPGLLVPGRNVLAVEVHQYAVDNAKHSFDLALFADEPVQLTRGPYLQMGAPQEATIRWRTNVPSLGRVRYGVEVAAQASMVDETAETTEHVVRLQGIVPNTRYAYSIGTPSMTLAGDDNEHFFVTPPVAGQPMPTRMWVIGDSGTGTPAARAVYDKFREFTGRRHPDLWLMLGDNAYPVGSDDDYQHNLFEIYPELLANTFLWPALGNHETYSPAGPDNPPYLDMFTLPTGGEVGGVPSGTERYYSFDHGDIHFVVLDSMTSRRVDSAMLGPAPMLTWLRADLAANDKTWLIAFWHHPPYTKGSHDSDNLAGGDAELVEMRENVLPILEDFGVDLVLSGHSHIYERSFLLDGHYGDSSSVDGTMKRDHGSGRPNETGAYRKSASKRGTHDGAVYVVAGSSGQSYEPVMGPHPAMFITLAAMGSLVVDVDERQLKALFLREKAGPGGFLVQDEFVIQKGAPAPTRPPGPPQDLAVESQNGSQATLVWHYDGRDEDGFIVERSEAGAAFSEYARLGANAGRFVDPKLTPIVPTYYQVRAYNSAGISSPSNGVGFAEGEVTAAPPAPIDVVTVGGGGCDCRMASGTRPPSPLILLLSAGVVGLLLRRRRRAITRGRHRARRGSLGVGALALLATLTLSRYGRADQPLLAALADVDAEIQRQGPQASNTDLSLRRADLLRRLHRWDEALLELQRLSRPVATPALDIAAARILIDAGLPDAGLLRLDHALGAAADQPAALVERGRLLMTLGRPAAAAIDFSRSLAGRGPSAGPEDHLELVRALRRAGQPGRAQTALARARARYGPLVILDLEAIDLALARGRFDQALALIADQLAMSPRKETWLVKRAAVLKAAGRASAPRASYRQAQAAIAQLSPAQQNTRAVQALAQEADVAISSLR